MLRRNESKNLWRKEFIVKEYNHRKNWLHYRLIFIESLIFLLPAVTVIYLFYNKKVILEMSHMFIVSAILILILAGFITLRHIFEKFHQIIDVISASKSFNLNNMEKQENPENKLRLITRDLKSLMEDFEVKTAVLNEKTNELYIIKDIIKLLSKNNTLNNLPDILLEKAMSLTGTKKGVILFSSSTGKKIRVVAQNGLEHSEQQDYFINSLKSKIPEIFSKKEYLVVDIREDNDISNSDLNNIPTSMIYLPFLIRQNILGIIVLAHVDNDKNFTENTIETLDILVDETGFAFDKIRMKKELKKKIRELNSRANEIEETNRSLQNEIKIRKFVEDEKDKLQSQLHVAQKLEALGTLAGGIAHNFNNLLMGIQGNATLIHLGLDNKNPISKRAQNIEKLVQSGSKLTSQLLGYARKGQLEMTPIDLNCLINDICETFANTKKGVIIHKNLSDDLYRTMADANQIEQVLLNLFVNAADAMADSGRMFISSRNCNSEDFKDKPYIPRPNLDYILLSVTDTGEGMDKDIVEKVFEPFFSTKEPGKGTGLGLASCYGIIKGHGGFIDVDSEPGKGSTFMIYLPASNKKSTDGHEEEKNIRRGNGKILVIDDEELILEVSVVMARELGYSVIDAKNGKEAVEKYKKFKDDIDMVILDMVMPDQSGEEVFALLKEINPDVRVLLASGYTFNNRVKSLMERGCIGFLKKPYSIEELSNRLIRLNPAPHNQN